MRDKAVVAAIQGGLPLVSQPFKVTASALNMSESELLDRIEALTEQGVIKRFGIVVRHQELGYRANAMVVWDIPDVRVTEVGRRLGEFDCVTLCYQRPRRLPLWPYNLFCMVHGLDRHTVLDRIKGIAQSAGLQGTRHEILFSGRRFKQRGARYLHVNHESSRRRLAHG